MNQHQDSWLQHRFAPISLEQLNNKAAMLSRTDNKYIVPQQDLHRAIDSLSQHFDVLEINRKRSFYYETRYFDDEDNSSYFDHHRGMRKRFKVRIRNYVGANLCFLEVKVKGKRGMTIKHRMAHDPGKVSELSGEALSFAGNTYSTHYGRPFDYRMKATLDMRYQRITLVAKNGGERMTIDTDLQFSTADRSLNVGRETFIIETKSERGRGIADKCLREVNLRPTNKCSKYCVGMASLGLVARFNRFLPAMRKLRLAS